RVHGNAANRGADTAPADSAGLADLAQAVLFVADFANGGAAVDMHAADFAGAQANLGVSAFTGQQHCGSAGRACDLRTLARHHFDAVNGGTHGNIADRQRVACADRGITAGEQRCADRQATGSDDVAALAIGVDQQSNVCRAVGVVFQALYLGGYAVLVATEIHQAVVLLVTAAAMAHGDDAAIVAARAARLLFQQ